MKKAKNMAAIPNPRRVKKSAPVASTRGVNALVIAPETMAEPSMFKCGGKVKKTGMALVHKGEKVMTKKQQKKGCC